MSFEFQMSKKRSAQRVLSLYDDEDKFYRLKILLPNSTSVPLALTDPEPRMSMKNFVNLVKEEYEKTRKDCVLSGKMRKRIDWNLAAISYLEFNGEKIKDIVRFEKFKPDLCNIIRLDVSWFLIYSLCYLLYFLCVDITNYEKFDVISGSGWVWRSYYYV